MYHESPSFETIVPAPRLNWFARVSDAHVRLCLTWKLLYSDTKMADNGKKRMLTLFHFGFESTYTRTDTANLGPSIEKYCLEQELI